MKYNIVDYISIYEIQYYYSAICYYKQCRLIFRLKNTKDNKKKKKKVELNFFKIYQNIVIFRCCFD